VTFVLNDTSLARLQGVHPRLVAVVKRAVGLSTQAFFVVEGARTREQMMVNYGKGRTVAECEAKGVPGKYALPQLPKVTWLNDPFKSNHRVYPDGFGHAVDLGALVGGKYDGSTVALYDQIAIAMFKAASSEAVHLRWGGDWDGDGHAHEHGETDLAHFEIV
jgi:peptidoglycan L-alanyl-D-glutamate endopeptidase CwlK